MGENFYRDLKNLNDQKIDFDNKVIDSLPKMDDDFFDHIDVKRVKYGGLPGGISMPKTEKVSIYKYNSLRKENEKLIREVKKFRENFDELSNKERKRLNFLESNRIGSVNYYKKHYYELREKNEKLKEENNGMRNDIKNKTFKYPSKRGNEELRQEALGWQEKYLDLKNELKMKNDDIHVKNVIIKDRNRIIEGDKKIIDDLKYKIKKLGEDRTKEWVCLQNEKEYLKEQKNKFNEGKSIREYALKQMRDKCDDLTEVNKRLAKKINYLTKERDKLSDKNKKLVKQCNTLRKENNNVGDFIFDENLMYDDNFIRAYDKFVRNNYLEDPRIVVLENKIKRLESELYDKHD